MCTITGYLLACSGTAGFVVGRVSAAAAERPVRQSTATSVTRIMIPPVVCIAICVPPRDPVNLSRNRPPPPAAPALSPARAALILIGQRGRSSIGRAPRLQRGGCQFDPGRLHFQY